MKKLILSIVVCLALQLSFSQDLIKLDFSDIDSPQFLKNKYLDNFKYLATSGKVGVAYLQPQDIKIYNKENTVKLIRVTSNNIEELNTTFTFSDSVEMIIIKISKSNFNLDIIDCSKLAQFKNLKYIYYIYESEFKKNAKLHTLNCLQLVAKQYYTKQLPQ